MVRCSRLLVACMLLSLVMGACAHKKAPSQTTHPRSGRQHTADPKAQQRYYDQGLQQYSKENYSAARDAFQQALEINPGNTLGLKARENIKKIDRIMQTLEDMEKK